MSESVIVFGAGPGLGAAVGRAFAAEGFRVALSARDAERLQSVAADGAGRLVAMPCDATDPAAVAEAIARCERDLGPLACAVFNAGAFSPGGILDIDPEEFERCWRAGAFAGFLVGQAAARIMAPRGRGTIIFTGATASLRGSARYVNLAAPKFALRAIAQSMARELGPRGLHIAHVVVDGQIRSPRFEAALAERGPDALLEPDAIATLYVQLHRQERSVWTLEADVRPWSEKF